MPPQQDQAGADISYPVTISFEQAMRGTTVEVRLNSPDRSIDETISVKVPPGVDEGAKVRVRGKGQPPPGGRGVRGDLLIITHIEPHAYFKREGSDILLDLPISAAEAATGTTVSVPTLDGPLELRIPPGIGSGKRLRIREKGVPVKSGTRGDQFCRILVQVPPDLTPAEKEQLAAMEKAHGFSARKDVRW
jgi:DnaJ-class molecular chaperone